MTSRWMRKLGLGMSLIVTASQLIGMTVIAAPEVEPEYEDGEDFGDTLEKEFEDERNDEVFEEEIIDIEDELQMEIEENEVIFGSTVNDSDDNDTSQKAQSFTLGSTIKGSIAPLKDVDFYSFTLSESGKVTLDMTSYMKNYVLSIYDTSSNVLWYIDDKAYKEDVGFREDEYYIYLEKGTYYLKVTGQVTIDYDGYLSTGNYFIETSFVSVNANESEPNNSVANANTINLGSTVKGLIAQNDKMDFYAFTLGESGSVKLEMTSYLKNYSFIIYDKTGEQIWYADDKRCNESVGFREDQYNIDLEKGTYYLKVTGQVTIDYDGYLATGNYSIKTSFVSANATEDEPNNNIANANKAELGDIIRGLIAQNDKIDYYKFVLDKSENVSLKITAYMKNYTLVIYDKSGDRLWYADDKRYNESVGFREDDFNIDL
ncbi:MAG: PPC domain-containing protein, partial [Lachnospiraceae bacterium]|nr:PPC domain-containing protein [Lachnospiraceae bacterium]